MTEPGGLMDAEDFERWRGRALDLGADEATVMRAQDVVVADWVRMKCLFGCDDPKSHRTCPPNAPPVDQTRRIVGEFEHGILLEAGPITGVEKSDNESLRLNRAGLALERELFLHGFHKVWLMGSGPCDLCGACTRGDECPTPERARPSMEGCGIDVYSTVRKAGRKIEVVRTKQDEYRLFALVLVD